MMNVIVILLLSFLMDGVFGADEMKVTEGESLTLPTGLPQTQSSDRILWLYGSDKIIARIENGTYSTNVDDERFKDNLELDTQTGSLTIKKNRIKNSGLYELDINRRTTSNKFSVKVYASLPTPDIDSPQCAQTPAGSSSPKCVFQCSVQTSEQTTLSWYRGNTEVSSKISDICSSISLRLEVNYEDKNIYSCMVNNPISNKTQHVDITQLCQPCEAGLSSGAVAGIVIVVLLVFAAAAAAVIYYLRKISELVKQISESVTVFEGDPVTLNTDVPEIQKDVVIEWRCGDGGSLIAAIRGGIIEIYDTGLNGRFLDRLELDKKTGSLTIKNTINADTGLYELKISQDSTIKYIKFNVSVRVKTVSAFEGDPVTLQTDTEVQSDGIIEWRFGGSLIVEIRGGFIEIYDARHVRFKYRMELDKKTGSLTIKNTEIKQAGVYQLKIKSISGVSYKKFRIVVRERNISVEQGKNVILDLDPETEIQKDDQIQWKFEDILIAEIRGGTGMTHNNVANGRFRGRLKLDMKTGSLIITDTTAEQSGVYKLQISSSRGNTNKRFVVSVYSSLKMKSVIEGESVTLNPETEIQKDDQIQWRFGDILIAEIRGWTGETHDDNGRFRDRLKLDEKTGSLTITDMRIEHTGDYKLQISSSRGNTNQRFKVVVLYSENNSKTVLEGEDVTLSSNASIVKDVVQWLFNDETLAIVMEINKTLYCDERFKDRLKLDHKTGSLTIKNTRTSDSGDYRLKFLTLGIERRFHVTVNVKDSATVMMPPVNEEDLDAGNEGMKLLVMK